VCGGHFFGFLSWSGQVVANGTKVPNAPIGSYLETGKLVEFL
jgi:hypothetical protein